jgi:MoxR-like ATPase
LGSVTRDAVLQAIHECDRLGREEFLRQHGFQPARDYVLIHDGKAYDSKAVMGVAYGFEHPDEGPLRSQDFSGGRETVGRAVEALGFEIARLRKAGEVDRRANQRVWLIRAGREGQQEQLALDESVALIGWSELGEVNPSLTREDLKRMIRERTGETRSHSLSSQAGQIYRFIHEVDVGDLVVLPLITRPGHVAIGRIVGSYQYRDDGPFASSDGRNTRNAEWVERALPYERFDPDLRDRFGLQGTVREINVEDAAARINEVLNGADASAIHLVLKWSPALEPKTIEYHREVDAAHGGVWWGRVSKPGTSGMAADRLQKFRDQLERGSLTHVYLHSAQSTWCARLLAITTDRADVEADLIPPYYTPETYHSLWVKITDFEETDPSELVGNFVLAQSGDPVTAGGLGNQGPLIIRKMSVTASTGYFILNQSATGGQYEDFEGLSYHWTNRSSGAWKQLANSTGARFIYYRPGDAPDETAKTYFGSGRIASISREDRGDAQQHFIGRVDDFRPFDVPVPWKAGPSRNAQTSIQPISRAQYEELVALGRSESEPEAFDVHAVRASAEERGLSLSPSVYAQVVAALTSGKHVILTGPPGTAKTTFAEAVAEAARRARRCDGYLLSTATADWTTFETIGGLRPTKTGELEFREGHFLEAIRKREWLVIDELNRSNFDRAFGQLFTVLSGQPVVLPYQRTGERGPLTLVPEGKDPPIEHADVLEIPQAWRIVATMNVFDKNLLFDMSFALMRRFAFIEVPAPSLAVFEALIDRETGGEAGPAALAKHLLAVRQEKDLGPAVFMDLARYLRERLAIDPGCDEGELLFAAFYSYLLPQFEGIDDDEGERLFRALTKLFGTSQKEHLRLTLNAVLGLQLQSSRLADEEAEDLQELEEPDEPDVVLEDAGLD